MSDDERRCRLNYFPIISSIYFPFIFIPFAFTEKRKICNSFILLFKKKKIEIKLDKEKLKSISFPSKYFIFIIHDFFPSHTKYIKRCDTHSWCTCPVEISEMETLWRTGLFEVRSRHFDVIRVIRQCIIHIARDEGVRYIVLTNINMRGSRCPYFQSKNICCELLVRARNYWGIDNRICTFSFVVNAKRSLARRVDNFIYRLIPFRLIRRCQEKIWHEISKINVQFFYDCEINLYLCIFLTCFIWNNQNFWKMLNQWIDIR